MAAELHLNPVRIDGTEMLDAMVTSVFLLDQELNVQYLNAAAQTLLGLGPNQALRRRITELTRGADTLLPMFDRARNGGEGVVQRELAWPGSGNVDRILDCAVTQVNLHDGQPWLLLEIEDITQHRRLTRENALLAQLGGSRLMVRQLAHEIKNPLGGLRGAAQLLEREYPDTEHREYTQVIIREADRLQNLVDRLLGPNRLPQKAMVNVHQILEHVRQLLEAEAPTGIVVLRDYDPSIPEVHADREQLIQATLNVTRNALQALGGKGSGMIVLRTRTRRQVTIGGRRHKLAIQMDVEDNGPGIPPQLMEKVFYPMVTTRAEGTGLGLPIAQYLIHSHGGLIECQSQPGRTVFSMFLPLGDSP